ncbi:MAG: hypothetical protein HC895_02960 [Leptolyngbyaceae cyanobacterium SM1_3_5]|nr:hypothetical protein [Leptolyngbyaceae cyanobacterium SM1_3_5]
MAIDPALLSKHFPGLEWRLSSDSACAKVVSESRFIDPSITVLDYKDGTFSASLYLNDTLQLSSWIEDESLEGVLVSLKGIMSDLRDALDRGLQHQAPAIE